MYNKRGVKITINGQTKHFIECGDGVVIIDGHPGLTYTSAQLEAAIAKAKDMGATVEINEVA